MRLDNLKFGLVIQGPIRSNGFNGASWCSKHGGLTDNNLHDASSEISFSYSEAKKIFAEVVVVTWSGEDTSQIEKVVPARDLIKLDPADFEGKVPENSYPIGSKNTKRQFFTSREGLRVLQSRGCHVSVKQRSDVSLNIFDLHAHLFKRIDSLGQNMIIIPLVNLRSLNWIQDFYFAGWTTDLISWADSILHDRDYYLTSHKDLFYKLYFISGKISPTTYTLNFFNLFPSDTAKLTAKQSDLLQKVWVNQIDVFPKSIWNTLIWRGSPMSGCLDEHSEQVFEPPSSSFFEPKINFFLGMYLTLKSMVARDVLQYILGAKVYNFLYLLFKHKL